jgi:Family of unknown function (DUF6152)
MKQSKGIARQWVRWQLAAVALLTTGAAQAHHSFSVFDTSTEQEIEGDIVEFQWTNPHTWTWLDVKAKDGKVERWGLEGMSPNFLGRRGWNKNSLKPGDHVKITIYPLKSGEPGGTFLRTTLPDGSVKVMFGRTAE